MSGVEQFERGLTDDERRELTATFDRLRSMARTSLVKAGVASLAVCGVLAIITLFASDAPVAVIVSFWMGLALLFTFWIGLPDRKHARRQLSAIAAGLQHGRARVVRIRSARVVEFEEIEDEGACYAFDAGENRVVFIQGQEFYAATDFPNTDFSIVDVLGPGGVVVDGIFTKDGVKLDPERHVSRHIKNELTIPDHLEIVQASLDSLEQTLAAAADATRAAARQSDRG
jgi:hypothetical protein